MPQSRDHWFRAKAYGWGWGLPLTWQGWAVLAGYLVLVLGGIPAINPALHLVGYLAYVGVLSAVFIMICWRTGEPPRWRWGRQ
jgi:hypothetical protein